MLQLMDESNVVIELVATVIVLQDSTDVIVLFHMDNNYPYLEFLADKFVNIMVYLLESEMLQCVRFDDDSTNIINDCLEWISGVILEVQVDIATLED